MSVELPAANGTTARIGFVGHVCASASVMANDKASALISIGQIGFMTISLNADEHQPRPFMRPIHYCSGLDAEAA
jgi:hypothetical protein